MALPALILALLETSLRISGGGRPAAFFVQASERGFIRTNQFFGRRFFPASIARTPEVERFPSVKAPGTYRVFVLGGSAAMGFPEPAFGVARVLETLLEEEYEGLDAEVINAAMTAVNSHVVLPVVRECARYEPDALVIYLGNNEFVGPYGPSSVFGAPGAPLPVVRVAIRVGATRTVSYFGKPLDWGAPAKRRVSGGVWRCSSKTRFPGAIRGRNRFTITSTPIWKISVAQDWTPEPECCSRPSR